MNEYYKPAALHPNTPSVHTQKGHSMPKDTENKFEVAISGCSFTEAKELMATLLGPAAGLTCPSWHVRWSPVVPPLPTPMERVDHTVDRPYWAVVEDEETADVVYETYDYADAVEAQHILGPENHPLFFMFVDGFDGWYSGSPQSYAEYCAQKQVTA